MTTWSNADLLVETLDRQLALLLKEENERRVLFLDRFLRFVVREPQIAGIVRELIDETRQFRRDATKVDHEMRETLAAIWKPIEQVVRAIPCEGIENEVLNDGCRMDSFVERAARRPLARLPNEVVVETETEAETLAQALCHWTKWASSKTTRSGGDPSEQLTTAELKANEASSRLRFLKRRFRTLVTTLPGVAYLRLTRIVRQSNPRPPIFDPQDDHYLGRFAIYALQEEFATEVHSRAARDERALEPDVVTAVAKIIEEDARLLVHELQLRILMGRSRLALVNRYAHRCSFEAAALREMIERDPSHAERQLTSNFAKYLFDQGLTPILDAAIAGLRPDVIDVAPGFLFYVEAKQYGDRASRSHIVRAYCQVWSTWGRVETAHEVPEAFLLVFRVAGPRLELPALIRHGKKKLYSVLVDISANAGSRETTSPLSFTESELSPSVADESER